MENDRHLGMLPEPWEVARGSIAERTAAVGRSAIDFRELTHQGDASGDNKAWQKVQSLGAESLQLVMGDEDPLHKHDKSKKKKTTELKKTFAEDDDIDIDDVASDINAILDADYDTSSWSVHEIESACNTLLEECESTLVLRRRVLATRMLLRLIDRHDEARRFVEKAFETVVNRGIPAMSYGISDRTFCVAHLLAAVAPRLAEKLSNLNVVPRIAKMITRFAILAAQVIQNRMRLFAKAKLEKRQVRQGMALPPVEVRARLRLMANMKTTDINARFKAMRLDPMGGKLPSDVLLSYLCTLREVTVKKGNRYAGANCTQLVNGGGLTVIVGCLKDQDKALRVVGNEILQNIGCEEGLLCSILQAQAVPALQSSLSEKQDIEVITTTLEAFDVLATTAVMTAALPENEMGLEGVEDQMDITSLMQYAGTELLPKTHKNHDLYDDQGRKTRDAIRNFFIQPKTVEEVLGHIKGENSNAFLGSTLVVHKMASTVFYHVVLTEVCASGGAVLERLIDAFQSTQELLAVAAHALINQLATRPEGRDAMITSGIVDMLAPLLIPARDPESREFLLAIGTMCSLGEHATLSPLAPNANALDTKRSKLKDRIYQNLMATLARPSPAAEFFVRRINAMKATEPLLRFLVRPDNPAHIFDLPRQHRYLGGVILHRMASQREAKGTMAVYHHATMLYGAFLIQHNYGEMSESGSSRLNDDDVPLLLLSTQASCSLLSELAGAEPPDARATVALKLRRTNAVQEVISLLQFPEAKYDQLYGLKMECVVAAALLISSIGPRPETDALPEQDLELLIRDVESNAAATPRLLELIHISAKALLNILQCCKDRAAISAACIALARLGATNESAAALLNLNIVKILAKLVPSRPTVKHNMTSSVKGALMWNDAQQMERLSPSFFRLLGCLTRIPDGVADVQATGLLKRSVERMTMGNGDNHDIAVKTEIALILSRVANSYSPEFGSSTDLILTSKYKVVPTLLSLMERSQSRRTRYAGAAAIRALCDDLTRGVPTVAKETSLTTGVSTIPLVISIVNEPQVPHPLLRQCLQTVFLITSCPDSPFRDELLSSGAKEALQHIASDLSLENAYKARMDRVGLGDISRDALSLLSNTKSSSKMLISNESSSSNLALIHDGNNAISDKSDNNIVNSDDSLLENMNDNEMITAIPGTYSAMGITSHGSLDTGMKVIETETPLALLSARDKEFRKELRRRKKYHGMERLGEIDDSNSKDIDFIAEDDDDDASGGSLTLPEVGQTPLISFKGKLNHKVAVVTQNPQLLNTRPPPRTMVRPPSSVATTPQIVPLNKQKRNQIVTAQSKPLKKDSLMLDPCFEQTLVNISGDLSKQKALPTTVQLSATSFGAEQFRHVSTIMGHKVDISLQRSIAGRVSDSSAHSQVVSFKNVEQNVSAVMGARSKTREVTRS